MKNFVLSLAAISTLSLSGCGSETIEDVKNDAVNNSAPIVASARVIFDPANGILSVPNDLLFGDSPDGTLHMPVTRDAEGNIIAGEKLEDGSEIENPNYGDPKTSLGTLDGWSVAQPFVLDINFPQGTSLDGDSVANPNSVRIFEATMGGDLTDADCTNLTRGLACKIVNELAYSQDFITQKLGDSIIVMPLKPFNAKTTYIVTLTDNLKDSNGKAIAGSTTYESVRQDITTHPLATPSQLQLQGLTNSFETAVVAAGVDKDSIIYTFSMTTQSTSDANFAVKSLMAANLALGSYPILSIQDTIDSVADVLAGTIPPESVQLYKSANYMKGSITLPYYLGIPSFANPKAPVNSHIKALCDSGAMLAGLAALNPDAIPAQAIPGSVSDATCIAISEAKGLAAPGLRDLSSLFPLDTKRHITKFNPVPAASPASDMPWIGDPGELEVQLTTPDIAQANIVRNAMGLADLVKPENGWPVVILQHGFKMNKEHMLLITGVLSINGLATVAIDLPLHGTRGFDLDFDGNDDINASISPFHFANLSYLPSARDNFKQANADMLGLRFGLNFVGAVDISGNPMDLGIDRSKVHFFGLSLGAITGINFVALANTSLDPVIDGMFKISAASFVAPGLMFANFGMESPAFTHLAKSQLTYAASADFKALVDSMFPLDENDNSTATQVQLTAVYLQFYEALTSEQQADLNGQFAQFTFAAQTLLDSGDPISYTGILAATQTPTHLIEIVGNGVDNLSDQVVTNIAPFAALGGTEPIITLLDLPAVSQETTGDEEKKVSGAVKFLYGHHSSVINPTHYDGVTASEEFAARATKEMQTQVATFLATGGTTIPVVDSEIVK
ncbi:MAG: lipase [Colwellia sp.]|nr:lipase [Colwellia sp.]